MPKSQVPGRMFYATATKPSKHGEAVVENGVPGIAVKQRATAQGTAINTHQDIAVGEPFVIIAKGRVEVPDEGYDKGTLLHIDEGSNDVNNAGTGVPFGRVVEVPGERGLPGNLCKVDLDFKYDAPAPTP